MLKFITEFAPLIIFFISYKVAGIFEATLYMLIASSIGLLITYTYKRKVNIINLVSTCLLCISASLTLLSGNTIFIKMKPTILYCLFAIIFFTTNFKWQPAAKYILGKSIQLEKEEQWYILNSRFMWFLLSMAIINEFIWRNFDENIWVNFKVLGIMPITIIFILMQIPFLKKNQKTIICDSLK